MAIYSKSTGQRMRSGDGTVRNNRASIYQPWAPSSIVDRIKDEEEQKSSSSLPTFDIGSKIGASAPKLQFEEPIQIGKKDTTPTRIYEEATEKAVEEPTFLERVGKTLSGAGKQSGSGFVNTQGTLFELGQGQRDRMYSDMATQYKKEYEQAQKDLSIMERENREKPGTYNDAEMRGQRYILEDAQRKYEALSSQDVKRAQQGAVKETQSIAVRLAESGQKDTERAKQGLGTVGRLAVDVGTGMTQLAADAALGTVTGLGTAGTIALRGFGSGAQQARQEGATLGQQIAYGLGTAAVEALTEKIGSVGNFNTKLFGKGAADDILEGVVAAVERAAKTETGAKFLNRLTSAGVGFLSEGIEEFVSGVVDPVLRKMTYAQDESIDWKQTLQDSAYDFLVGGVIGFVMDGVGGTDTSKHAVARTNNAIDSAYDAMKQNGMFSEAGTKALSAAKTEMAWERMRNGGTGTSGATVAANQITQRVAAGTNTSGTVDTSSKITYNKPVETVTDPVQQVEALKRQQQDARRFVSPAASSAVKQTAAQAENTQLQNPESDVLDAATTAWMGLGMNLKTAKQRAEITQKLIRGEEVTVREINKLDPTNKEAQKVFSELTGVQFPDTKMPLEQTYNLFRSASTVAQTAQMAQEAAQERSQMQAAERAKVETEIAQMGAEVAQAVQQQTGKKGRSDEQKRATREKSVAQAKRILALQSQERQQYLAAKYQEHEAVLSQLQVGDKLITDDGIVAGEVIAVDDLGVTISGEMLTEQILSGSFTGDGVISVLEVGDGHFERADGTPIQSQVRTGEQASAGATTAQQQSGQEDVTGDTLALDNGGAITREQFTAFVQDYYNTQGKPVTETQANVMFNQLQARAAQGQPMQYFPEMDRYMKEDKEDGRQVQARAEGNQEAGVRTPAPTDRRGREQDVGRGAEDSGRGVRRSAGSDTQGDRRDGSAGAGDDVARRGLDAGGRGESESREGQEGEGLSSRRLRGERSPENTGGGSGRSQVVGRSVRGLLEVEGSVTEAKDTRELLEQSLREAGKSGQTQEQRAEAIRGSGLRSRSKLFRELGGSQAVVAQQDYTPEMKRIASFVKRVTGADVYFKIGTLYDAKHRATYSGVYLPGDHVIILRADHPSLRLAQVFGHEIFHCFSVLDQRLPERIIQRLAERTGATVEDFNKAISKCFETPAYLKAFGGPMNDENRSLYYEEFIGDLHGGMNFRLKWDDARFNGIKAIVDDEIAKWEAEWAEKGQLNTATDENSDSSEGRVFPLSTEKLWEEQLEEMNETSSQDALYIEETPNLLAEVGLGDLPLCMTKAHMRNALHERVEGNDHYHAVPYRVALELPELLSRPAMILKSRTQRGDIVVVTTAMDNQGDPVVVSIHPNGRATVDGTRGPANFITSMYGRNNFAPRSGRSSKNNMLYLALHNRSILYWNKDRMGQLARDCRFQIPLGISKVPADTILGVHEGYRKSQIPQRMFSFDEEDIDINDPYLLLSPPMFSKLEQEVEKFKGEKIGASSIVSYLRGKGVKAEEIKWSGIEPWLAGKKSVTKQELLEFLRNNRIRVETETRSDAEAEYPYMDTDTGELYESVDAFWAEAERRAVEMGYRAEDVRRGFTDEDGYTSFYLYRPTRDGEEEVYVEDLLSVEKVQSEPQTKWGEYITGGGTNYRELLFKLPGAGYSNQAMKVHWGTEDVLAHARVQDFETPTGERVLFVEEIQSDWHNAGAKNGYATPDAVQLREELDRLEYKRGSRNGITFEERDRIEELQAKLYPEKVRLEEKTRALRDETGTNPALVRIAEELIRIGVSDNIHQARMQILVGGQLAFRLNNHMGEFAEARVSGEDIEALRDFTRRKANHEAELQQYRNTNHDLVPDAPFSKNYHEFVLKNLLREAAEKGYGYLAWTTGKMQEERWSSDYAEGYRIEYDQDIPKFLNKYGRQWGAQVQGVQIVTDEGKLDVPGIPVNDAMKQDVLYKGQPMFSFDDGSDNEEHAPGSLFDKVFGESKAPRVGGAIDPSNAKRRGNRFFDKKTGEELYLSNDLSMYGGLLYRDEVGDYLDIPKDYEDVDADLDPGDLLDFTEGSTDLYADDEGLIGFDEDYEGPADFEEEPDPGDFASEVDYLLAKDRYDYAKSQKRADSPVATMEKTPTNTAAFKKWFKDPTGKLSNPDGTPKLLLHGTPRGGFTSFDMGKMRKSESIYLSDSMGAARNYAYRGMGIALDSTVQPREFKPVVLDNWGQAAQFAQADLGMRLELTGGHYALYKDAAAAKPEAIFPNTPAGLDRFNKQYGSLSSQARVENPAYYAVYASLSDPLVFDARGRSWDHLIYSGKQRRFLSTDDLATYAREAGYDGVIIENIRDGDASLEADEFGYAAEVSHPFNEYIVFNPRQVKSAYNTGTWNRRTSDLRFSFDEESTLASFMRQLEQEYGEGSAEQMFATMEQLDRARQRAEQRAADADAIAQAAEWTAAAEVEAARQAERDLADQRLSEQRDKANEQAREKAAKARAEKAEAVRSARLAEQMNAGRTWSARLRRSEEKAVTKQKQMQEAAKNRLDELRSRKDQEIENTKLAEQMNAGRKMSKAVRRWQEKLEAEKERRRKDLRLAQTDAKEAAAVLRKYHKGDVEALSNSPVATIRGAKQNPAAADRAKALAGHLRTLGREFYKTFINGTQAVDDFSNLQNTDATASVLLRNAIGVNSTIQTILRERLVGKDGSTIDGQSLEDVAICWSGSGKSRKYDDDAQRILQDYMLHRHNIDRMSLRDNARQAVEDFEAQHSWLTSLDPREFAELVTEDNRTAQRYMELIEAYQKAKNKPIFQGEDGKPLSAEYSQSMVDQYEQQYGWLKEKAEGIYEWWDKFMQEWVVGESLSQEEYAAMRQLYPSYVPTYRKDKHGSFNGISSFGGTVTTKKGARRATGGTSEVVDIEDSFMRLLQQNVRSQRANAVLRSIVDSAMTDTDGALAGFAIFDWDEASTPFRWSALAGGIDLGVIEAGTNEVAVKALSKDGGICRVRAWVNGEQVSAIVDEELYKALDFALNSKTGWFTKLGETLSAWMKTAITGANPAFAIRNAVRDNLTAQINSVSVVNSISGIKFEKYLAQAVKEMVQNSENWQRFKALGGTHATYYRSEQGSIVESVQRRGKSERNPVAKAIGTLSWMGENTEAATRFAEYLATIDRLPGGDTYTNRMIGIKNAAEVTVDFSRKGTAGKAINAWVPYWNPGVQGIDKVFRAFFDQPTVAGKLKLLSRTALTTAPLDILLYALYHYLDRDDEWEELNDRTKDTYYCIPLPDEHTFLKVPKSRDWGQLIGTPLMRMLQGLDGREDPFKNYFEVALAPNFLWSNPTDALGINWVIELKTNKDFADRDIVPYPYTEMAKGDQWNSDTSKYAKAIAEVGNMLTEEDWLSPMQLDYIINDYFGDFGSMFQRLFTVGGNDMEVPAEERVKLAAEDLFGAWEADNRYSSATVSDYYEMLDAVSQKYNAERIQNPDGYTDTIWYKLQSAFNATDSPVDRISNLNAQVRELPDGVEKDELKQQIIDTAREALDMYEAVLSGESTEPKLEMQYGKYGETVRDELISLAGYSEDYSFLPSSYKPSSYTDPKNKKREYVLDDTAKEKYRELYDDQYVSVMEEVIRSSKYRKASDTEKAELLEAARDDVAEQTKDEFMNWLTKNYKSTLKK